MTCPDCASERGSRLRAERERDEARKVLRHALAVGEIRFKTCVLSAQVHDEIVAALSPSVTTGGRGKEGGGEKCNHEERQVLASGEPICCVKPPGHEGHHGYRLADPPRASPSKTSEGA